MSERQGREREREGGQGGRLVVMVRLARMRGVIASLQRIAAAWMADVAVVVVAELRQ